MTVARRKKIGLRPGARDSASLAVLRKPKQRSENLRSAPKTSHNCPRILHALGQKPAGANSQPEQARHESRRPTNRIRITCRIPDDVATIGDFWPNAAAMIAKGGGGALAG